MPVINVENDPSVYTVTVRDAGEIKFDILEIVPVIVKAGISESNFTGEHVGIISGAMKKASSPAEVVGKCTDDQLFACALKALAHWKKVGNV